VGGFSPRRREDKLFSWTVPDFPSPVRGFEIGTISFAR
jgi:hypothetical protein